MTVKFVPVITVFLLFVFSNPEIRGQSIQFERITIENGLSQNTINAICQDKQGFLWLGTQDGLNRYDGYEFKVYRHKPNDTTSISHSWIWDIFEDSGQHLWIAPWKGLNLFDEARNQFVRFLPDSLDQNSIKGDRPSSIVEDSDGFLWIGTWGGGLNRYDSRISQFENFGGASEIPGLFIRDLLIDSNGTLWIGTWNGLVRMNKRNKDTYSFDYLQTQSPYDQKLKKERITVLEEDLKGRIWIGSLGNGLFVYNPSKDTIINYRNDEDQPP